MPKPIIIPTPQHSEFSGQELEFESFRIEYGELAAPYALELLQPFCDEAAPALLVLEGLSHPNSQAYEIIIRSRQVSIRAAEPNAFIYAVSTLLQMLPRTKGKFLLPEGRILDYPQFKYRGVNWNLLVECRGWSQDSGEGEQALLANFYNGLDLLAFFKLNAVFVDGVGWNPERFSGYAKLMRTLNQQARRRGIKLMFSGYNAGYGAQWQDSDGPVFRNQHSYPDGAIYGCLGSEMASAVAGTMGTCLSNQALKRAKQQNLIEFVRAVEPGMLYIHGLDISSQAQAISSWTARCPRCRQRWPNDEINAADGMAGAFAAFYDELYEAICEVENSSSGYQAARDCVVNMVSPNYSSHTENDAEWQYHLEYFYVLASCLHHQEIQLMLREQFFGEQTGLPRFEQLRQAVGKNCQLSVVYFSSGSGFYNNLPVTADAACIRYFTAMDSVIAGSGNAFQEARQAILAEYLWNPTGSNYPIELPSQSNSQEFLPYYYDLCHGRVQPATVFGPTGLLEQVCTLLYGVAAGPLVASAQRPEAQSCFAPEQYQKPSSLAALFPLHHELLPGFCFSVFTKISRFKTLWRPDLNEEALEFAGKYAALLPRLAEISRQASVHFRQAVFLCDSPLPFSPEHRRAHLERLAETCIQGASLLEFTQAWLSILASAWKQQQQKEVLAGQQIAVQIEELLQQLTQYAIPLQSRTVKVIDPSGADVGQALRTIEFIKQDLKNILVTMSNGLYQENKGVNWW